MGKYPLNGSHITEVDDHAMISTPADWPLGDRLPLKRRSGAGRPETGVMFAIEYLVIRMPDGLPAVYSTVDELLDDGWVVD